MTTTAFASRPALPPRLRRVLLRTAGILGADLVSQCSRILIFVWPIGGLDALALLAEVAWQSLALAAGLALVLEVHEVPPDWWPWPPSRLVLAAATGFVALGVGALAHTGPAAMRLGLVESSHSLTLYRMWSDSITALVAVVYLTRRRESSEVERKRLARELRLDQARRRLRLVSAQARQSRLEPQMLFDCLSRARAVYAGDLDRGDVILDRLTRYLRLTLAVASSGASTLGREASLAAARIEAERSDEGPIFVIEIAPALESRPFPPDVLGPLAQDWVTCDAIGGTPGLHIAATGITGGLRLTLLGPCPPPRAALAQCSTNLAALTGGRGVARPDPADPCRLTLEIADAE